MTKPPRQFPKPLSPLPSRKTWKAVLHDCGYPLDTLVLDAETYFAADYSLKDLTTIEYIRDPRFEVLGWASKRNNEPAIFTRDLPQFDPAAVSVVVFNAGFDALILERIYGIRPKYLIDVLALARHWNSRRRNDLGRLCEDYQLPAKGETENFKGLSFRRRFTRPNKRAKVKMPAAVPTCTPAQWRKLAGYAINDARREYDLLKIMLPRLSNPKTELRLIQHTIELATKPRLRLDLNKGIGIIQDMEAEIDKAVADCGMSRDEISKNTTYEAAINDALRAAGENPQNYWKPCKTGYKLADSKTDPEREKMLNHPHPQVKAIAQARAAIKSWPLHISRVESLIRMGQADDGRFAVPLKYCGAHTGRWSGADGVNPQNFGSRGHALISSVRHMIVPPPGDKLVIVDAAQIEARMLAWLADETDLVATFADGRDVYSEFGSVFYGSTVRKAKPTDPPAIAKLMTARRGFSKICILGMGYGMGAARFAEYASVDAATAQRAIEVYRETYPKIVQYWRDVEKAFAYTAKYKRTCTLRSVRFDSLSDCDVLVTLPSGRELKYEKVRLTAAQYGDQIELWNGLENHWDHTWGGSLVENIDQAISRDVLAEAMLRLEDQGIHTALHVHDEVVIVSPADRADTDLAAAIKEMSRVPAWGPGLPLAAEGQIAERYQK